MPYRVNISPPRSQYDRNLTFRVVGGGPTVSFTFPIKPEEFQMSHPARVTTTQTLQGVYQDFGGLGVQTLTYQGHTGWRRHTNFTNYDGFQVFQSLYKNIYTEYHKRKQDNFATPDLVYALVIDDLFDTVYRVSLDDFQATKSKSKPLLYYYQLHMTVKFTSVNNRDPVDYLGLPNVKQLGFNQVAAGASGAVKAVSTYTTNATRTYKVQSGDSLWTIAVNYYGDGTRDKDIALANGIQPPYTIYPGTILTIPN
ncbi:LysM peptidoglycan-binding domain-containing protein [Fodinisporobacter ferrooxydans]|uniref:LysM peptidoglycan-binding domain-containing protein n=1 Tax=Fodinisporobacter ferrooxydans TaxID=2901836 RepID=A0ABY4CKA4_9BACL|nr:LysM peptidoglycan-binding domain-containing protein [Alicyclobacillaceae bacterium MYW30-H2]